MLPGGLWEGETRHRSFAFQALNGHLELAIADGASGRGDDAVSSLPDRVSHILAAAELPVFMAH